MKTKEYWEKRYKNNNFPEQPTDFALDVGTFIDELFGGLAIKLIDLGCGNGRDTYYFASKSNIEALGVDQAVKNKDNEFGALFEKADLDTIVNCFDCNFDVVYSRFFLHSISPYDIERLLKWTSNYFIAETRVEGDEPVLYRDHERTVINSETFIQLLISMDYEIIYAIKKRGLAKYKDEDPLVLRVIAKKKIPTVSCGHPHTE